MHLRHFAKCHRQYHCPLPTWRRYGTVKAGHEDDGHSNDDGHYTDDNQEPEARAQKTDWPRIIFKYGYMGGLAAFCYGLYYKPDTSLETWALGEAEKRMRERGVDMFWRERENFRLPPAWSGIFGESRSRPLAED